jgi:hypothetical protein
MKRVIYFGMTLVIAMSAFTSCKKERLDVTAANQEINNQSFSRGIKCENGILVFENEAHLNFELNKLANLKVEERLSLENKLNFRSLATIDKMINEAENMNKETFFKGEDPNLTVQEYEDKGLFYKHSDLFNEYLAKGVIERYVYKDKSVGFSLSVKNLAYQFVLNEDGKVIVGDKLFVFNNEETKIFNKNTMELIDSFSIGENGAKLNNQYNFIKNARRPGDIQDGSKFWIYDPNLGNNYRYYAQAVFSSSFTTTTLSQTYYWVARAEKKSFGTWSTNNNYMPIWGVSASWLYEYWVIMSGASYGTLRQGAIYPLPNSSGNPTSPYSLSSLGTNNTVRNMYPNGLYSITSSVGYQFFENVRVYNNSYTFKFSGGPSGYNYVAQ